VLFRVKHYGDAQVSDHRIFIDSIDKIQLYKLFKNNSDKGVVCLNAIKELFYKFGKGNRIESQKKS